ncbi:uncharacterized protein LOC143623268 [Bidens hawaiensis]|uniref:uncharacterized protein LOC143623268 n=1 Tax=Bidens hawaiensis TaxID=980011 RepID=UPI00404B545C
MKIKNVDFLMARRLKRQNRDRSGCMSGIVSIFDFRHGKVTRRLLSDHGAHMTESTTGPSCATSEVSSLMDSEDIMHPPIESPKSVNSDLLHTRVKELMEEDMQNDQTEKISNTLFDNREINIEDLMNKLILIDEKRNQEQKPTPFERSNSLDHKRFNQISESPVTRKPRNLFRRRSKSHECISLNDNDTPLRSNTANMFKVHHERSVSQFSFTEIKKKLKNAIGKRDSGCLEKPVVDGNSGWNSPNRDHFYSERFTRIPSGFTGSVFCRSERKLSGNEEFGDMSDQVSNIYIEAKKHLHELLKNEDEDTELVMMSRSRTLGNLLSFPGYTSRSSELGRRTEPVVNESQPSMTDDDRQEPKVSGEVHEAEGTVSDNTNTDVEKILEPDSPKEVEVINIADLTELEDELSCSPTASPTKSTLESNTKDEEVENTSDDKTGKPSPVSVLEPLFSDDDVSPARTISRSSESSIQPLRIRFEETVTPSKTQETYILNHAENEESAYEYVEAVLLASDLNWDEFEQRWLCSAEILDPSLYNELQVFSSRAPHDQLLLFDATNEILKEVCDCSLDLFPGLSQCKPSIHPVPKGMDLINEVWERLESRIYCHYPRSLDQLIKKDFKACGTWMDLRLEAREIVMEVEEWIFEDMVDDAVFSLSTE